MRETQRHGTVDYAGAGPDKNVVETASDMTVETKFSSVTCEPKWELRMGVQRIAWRTISIF